MSTIDKIKKEIKELSDIEQEKVLEALKELKANKEWNSFSLSAAMNGLENDTSLLYSKADLKEVWN